MVTKCKTFHDFVIFLASGFPLRDRLPAAVRRHGETAPEEEGPRREWRPQGEGFRRNPGQTRRRQDADGQRGRVFL